jgi:hypothetical protein
LRKQKSASRRLQHSTTFHCPEDFLFDNNTGADTSARSHAPNNIRRKRTQKREAPPSCFSGYQGEASFATSSTSWVHKLRPQGLMATTPSPGVTNSTSQTSLSQPTACFLFLSAEALTSLSFHPHSRSPTLTLSSPALNQPGVDLPSSTRTGVVPYVQRLYAVSRRPHICIT